MSSNRRSEQRKSDRRMVAINDFLRSEGITRDWPGLTDERETARLAVICRAIKAPVPILNKMLRAGGINPNFRITGKPQRFRKGE